MGLCVQLCACMRVSVCMPVCFYVHTLTCLGASLLVCTPVCFRAPLSSSPVSFSACVCLCVRLCISHPLVHMVCPCACVCSTETCDDPPALRGEVRRDGTPTPFPSTSGTASRLLPRAFRCTQPSGGRRRDPSPCWKPTRELSAVLRPSALRPSSWTTSKATWSVAALIRKRHLGCTSFP